MRRVTLLETYFRRRFLPTGQNTNKTILQKMRATHNRPSIGYRQPSLSLVELPLPAHITSPNGHRVSVPSKEGRKGRDKEKGSARGKTLRGGKTGPLLRSFTGVSSSYGLPPRIEAPTPHLTSMQEKNHKFRRRTRTPPPLDPGQFSHVCAFLIVLQIFYQIFNNLLQIIARRYLLRYLLIMYRHRRVILVQLITDL